MGYFDLFGWDIGLSDKSINEKDVVIGSAERALSGGIVDGRRDNKRVWEATTPPMVQADAFTLRNLIRGYGEVWTADDVTNEEYSSKGSGFASASAWTRSTVTPKYGAASYELASGQHIELGVAMPDRWTLLIWKYDVAWEAFALLDDGTFWDGTAKNSGSFPSLWTDTTTGPGLIIEGKNKGGAGATTRYDQIVFLPYRASDNFIEAYNASTVAPLSPGLSRLTMSGDILAADEFGGAVGVIGRSVQLRPFQGVVGGAWTNQARTVSFVVEEG